MMYVQELISEFTENDWDKLLQNLKDRDDKYKIRLVYCIDEDTGMQWIQFITRFTQCE